MDQPEKRSVLRTIAWVFWNPQERRLRLLLRLAGFAFVFMIFSLVMGLVQIMLMTLFGSGATPEELLSPAGANGFELLGPLLMVVATLGSMIISAWALDRRRFRDYGFGFNRRWWRDFGYGLFLGAAIMLVIFVLEWSLGWIKVTPAWQSEVYSQGLWLQLLQGLLLFLCVGIYEEALSRGYLLRNIAEGLNAKWWRPGAAVLLSVLVTSSIFGFAHASNPNATILSSVLISVAGLMLAAGYVLSGELAIPIGIHITWNFFQGYVFGFPVSGMVPSGSIFEITQGGPVLWTGGAFGPEAGMLGLLAMLVLILAIWLYTRMQQPGVDRFQQLVSPTLHRVSGKKGKDS
ncbi:MAG: CPBP family intramembrane metalloprotease [Anaerolineales bacterium]|nr:CPBP family intramembrane metalloprotease [Anaerolineales bacterium]